jgi:hypothetical protein
MSGCATRGDLNGIQEVVRPILVSSTTEITFPSRWDPGGESMASSS